MSSATVRPFTPDHSIHEVVFVINFANPIPESILKDFRGLSEKFVDELPKVDEQRATGFTFSPGEKVQHELQDRLVSIAYKNFNTKGDPIWQLRAEVNFLAVNCLEYTRWNEVWGRASKYLSIALPDIVSPDNPIVNLSLQYVDKFIHEGSPDSYQISTIFAPESRYLNMQVKESGPYWHLNQGWFVSNSDVPSTRVLNQLNITAALADNEHYTTIDHRGILQFKDPVSNSKSLLKGELDGMQALDFYFRHLHTTNKEILANLLHKERIEDISLFSE